MQKLHRQIAYFHFLLSRERKLTPSQEAMDVVIPIIKKDLLILPLCLEGIRVCVQNTVKNIYIVAPKQEEIIAFCEQNNLIFVDETSIFGFAPAELKLKVQLEDGRVLDRSGWLFQQFIKLSAAVGTCENYLCIDADHVLIRPHVFITSAQKPMFYMASENHRPYYDCIKRLLGEVQLTPLSYVAHKMLFNKQQVEALHEAIRRHTGKEWREAILDTYDRSMESGFSEFETYGNFVSEKVLSPWKQHALKYKKMAAYTTLQKRYKWKYKSLTFPEYYNN